MEEYTLTPLNINEPIPINVEILYCTGEFLPDEIGNCINLRELDCDGNQLTMLPELPTGNVIRILNCENNPLKPEVYNILNQDDKTLQEQIQLLYDACLIPKNNKFIMK